MDIYLHKYIETTAVEGPGRRFCVWLQGCSIHCDGCMLLETWPFSKKNKMSCLELVQKIITSPEIEGVTILGGEPFDQSGALLELVQRIKSNTSLSIMLFTGYTWSYLENKCREFEEIISNVDIFIEGPFVKKQTEFSRPWVGSSNQTIHFLTNRYSADCLGTYPPQKIEVRISKDGSLVINGMLSAENFTELCEDWIMTPVNPIFRILDKDL